MKVTGLRFFTVYGPWGRPDKTIYNFSKNIINNKIINVYNKGHHYRDFAYIDDIVSRILSAILRVNKSNYEMYNIGSGKPIYLKKLILIIENILKKREKKIFTSKQGNHEIY
jgi:UDP-glucuronate 4-epimerase